VTNISFTQNGTGAVAYPVSGKIGEILSAKDFGVVGDGATDDHDAIVVARTAAIAAGKSLAFPDGIYCHGQTIEWAYPNFHVIALGADVVFKHTGTGVAHDFNGLTHGNSEGVFKGVFGGPNRIFLKGNPAGGTTNLVYVNNWHFGEMKIRGRDASNAILFGDDTGIVNSCAVESTFDVQVSFDLDGQAFSVVPLYGIRMTKPASCVFPKMVVEGCGNVSSATPAVSLVGAIGNLFLGGTVESNPAGGVAINSTCSRNTFLNIDAEVNGAQQDWIVAGNNNVFISCSGGATTSGQYISGNRNKFINCNLQGIVVQPGAIENTFDHCDFLTAFTDLGTRTNVISPDTLASPKFHSVGAPPAPITQSGSKAAGVTLNAGSGAIVLSNSSLAAGGSGNTGIVSFVLTDSMIESTDVLVLNHISGGTPGAYSLNARCAAGSATIDVRNNTAGSLSEAIVIQFVLIKG
jgi:hypothetical protein